MIKPIQLWCLWYNFQFRYNIWGIIFGSSQALRGYLWSFLDQFDFGVYCIERSMFTITRIEYCMNVLLLLLLDCIQKAYGWSHWIVDFYLLYLCIWSKVILYELRFLWYCSSAYLLSIFGALFQVYPFFLDLAYYLTFYWVYIMILISWKMMPNEYPLDWYL